MPRVPRGLRRPAAGFLLLLHLTLVGGWIVHAVIEGPDSMITHVQSSDSHDGSRAHDERDCRLCQTATLPVLPASAATLALAEAPPVPAHPSLLVAARSHLPAAATRSRAPPLGSS